jgi:hypothetical protein
MAAISRTLEKAGMDTFLPHRDGVERLVLGLVNSPLSAGVPSLRDRIERAIFSLDVFQLAERCDCLVFNMNGRVPDEGGAVEAGIAFAAGKPVVLYKNDVRSAFKGHDNPMICGLSPIEPVKKLSLLPAAVLEAIKMHGGSDRRGQPPPAMLEKAMDRGRKIWKLMKSIPAGRPDAETEELMKRILELD